MYKPDPLKVPAGIRYITEWEDFYLPDHPCIIDKKLTGCGFTEYVIHSPFNSVLISPRTSLLKNKTKQHNSFITYLDSNGIIREKEIPEQRIIYYARAEKEKEIAVDKDLEAKKSKETIEEVEIVDIFKFKEDLKKAISIFRLAKRPIKIAVTYDSFRKVKEVLEELRIIDSFHFIVDEFQSIFTDSRFKPNTELEFLKHLQGLQKLCFVSATPYMEDYLNELDEFKDLPFYELDWETEDRSRIITPELSVKSCKSINSVAKKYITDHRNGIYDKRTLFDSNGVPMEIIEARELVFYVNSVRNICDIIRQNQLLPEDICIICANTDDNKKKIQEAFRLVFKEIERDQLTLPKLDEVISEVPIPDKQTGQYSNNKPITLCTKTVYLGADFYSLCARSIVLSDATIESLAVDITLDLPQILGRQRDSRNPWKNSLDIWVKYGSKVGDISEEEFEAKVKDKIGKTESLLRTYDNANEGEDKHNYASLLDKHVKTENYKDDYIAVNHHDGNDLKPQINKLVLLSERRAFRIQKDDYKDRVSVMASIINQFGIDAIDQDLQLFISAIESTNVFREKMRIICKYLQSVDFSIQQRLYPHIPEPFKTYYFTLGPDFIISVKGEKAKILEAIESRVSNKISTKGDLTSEVINSFKVGERYSKSQLKQDLQCIYSKLGISDKPKATDIERWFEIKPAKVTNKETGKRDMGFELISIKQ